MILIESIAVIFTLWCVYLAAKDNVWTWGVGLIGVMCYFIVFYDTKLYADMILQIVFFIQGLYGWWYWVHGSTDKEELPITTLTVQSKLIYVVLITLNTVLLGLFLKGFTDASLPYVDSFLAISSVTATFLLAYKKLENWYIWIFVDVLYVGLFTYKGLYLSAGLYFILGIIAYKGLLNWKKE